MINKATLFKSLIYDKTQLLNERILNLNTFFDFGGDPGAFKYSAILL